MSQNLTINGVTYNAVGSLSIPKSGGGSATFPDTSDADASVGDIATGKTAYVNGSKITGTATGGGGVTSGVSWDTINASNQVTAITIYGNVVPVYACEDLSITAVTMNDVSLIAVNAFAFCSSLVKLGLPSGLTTISQLAFKYCTGLRKVWIPSSCTTISATDWNNVPFYQCSSNLVFYCEAASKPAGWYAYWNEYGTSSAMLCTVNWGITKAQFDAL